MDTAWARHAMCESAFRVWLGCKLDDKRVGVRRPAKGERGFSFPEMQTGSAALPASYAIRIEVFTPWVK